MATAPPYDARAVANLILDLADSCNVRLTQMSVLKIIYFSHGWYLAIRGVPLCIQSFEAWEYGPVVKVVRDSFKCFENKPISNRAHKIDLMTGEILAVPPVERDEDVIFIKNVFDAYHVHDAWQLSEFTHEAGSPWDQLWNSPKPVGRFALRLKNEEIQAHFRSLRQRLTLS